jgi:hypothetical protein
LDNVCKAKQPRAPASKKGKLRQSPGTLGLGGFGLQGGDEFWQHHQELRQLHRQQIAVFFFRPLLGLAPDRGVSAASQPASQSASHTQGPPRPFAASQDLRLDFGFCADFFTAAEKPFTPLASRWRLRTVAFRQDRNVG